MLDQLEQLATSLGMAFGFGDDSELNKSADKHVGGFFLFHSGFHKAKPAILGNGGFQRTHQLTLFILHSSSLQDSIEKKRETIELIKPMSAMMLKGLYTLGDVTNPDETGFVNKTDRNLDGFVLTLTLKTPIESLC